MKRLLNIRKTHMRDRNRTQLEQGEAIIDVDPIENSLENNLKRIKADMENSADLVVREVVLKKDTELQLGIIYLDGLVDDQKINDCISLIMEHSYSKNVIEGDGFQSVFQKASMLGKQQILKKYSDVTKEILSGSSIIIVNGVPKAISGSSKGEKQRGIEEPSSQVVIRGPKDGFTESLSTNIALIRKRLKNPKLCVDMYTIGDVTNTDVALLYMEGRVNEEVLEKVKHRISHIQTEGIFESGNVEEFIEDRSITLFPTINNTERPDSAAANLLEGRIVILVDGTPFCLIAPFTFFQSFQSPEDYYHRYDIATIFRFLRFFSFLASLLGTSVYVAATTYHPEMIPTPLLLSLAAQREGMPFPIVIEALLMELSIEILREAGIRMPRAVGQAVSIVGALILGEAAVQAGIVSPGMVIIVAFTAITSFITPAYNMAISIRMLRFVLVFFSAAIGLYGIAIILIFVIAHLCSMQSLGVPYMTPIAPFCVAAQKDTLFRFPIWSFQSQVNKNRMKIDEEKQGHS
ncbi:spore germination protein [Halalkalibacter kiskunsagensis]|uniref:Spore germination protein n=1 Tax=Halalkalibacter kiskunsagensis TaxID=1548599 RepID=A0ABV6KD13_9BACI